MLVHCTHSALFLFIDSIWTFGFHFSAFLCWTNLCTSCRLKLSFMMNKNGKPTDLFMVLMPHAPNADMFSYTIRWSSAFQLFECVAILACKFVLKSSDSRKKVARCCAPDCVRLKTPDWLLLVSLRAGKVNEIHCEPKSNLLLLLLHDCTFRSKWIPGIFFANF